MSRKRMLAYITGSIDQELLLRNEFLVTENRGLRPDHRHALAPRRREFAPKGRLRLSPPERIFLA